MKYDQNISNGPACISAEWIHELNIWEHELAYTDDCLPLVPGNQIVSLTLVGAATSQTITATNPGEVHAPRQVEDVAGYVLTI